MLPSYSFALRWPEKRVKGKYEKERRKEEKGNNSVAALPTYTISISYTSLLNFYSSFWSRGWRGEERKKRRGTGGEGEIRRMARPCVFIIALPLLFTLIVPNFRQKSLGASKRKRKRKKKKKEGGKKKKELPAGEKKKKKRREGGRD